MKPLEVIFRVLSDTWHRGGASWLTKLASLWSAKHSLDGLMRPSYGSNLSLIYDRLSLIERENLNEISRTRINEISVELACEESEVEVAIAGLRQLVAGLTCTIDNAISMLGQAVVDNVKKSLMAANTIAGECGSEYIGSGHWLVSILKVGSPSFRDRCHAAGITDELLMKAYNAAVGGVSQRVTQPAELYLCAETVQIVQRLCVLYNDRGRILSEFDVVVELCRRRHSEAHRLLRYCSIDPTDLCRRLHEQI